MIRSGRRGWTEEQPSRLVAAACLLVLGAMSASAQESGPPALHLKVKPSGVDALSDEARARQEQLEARMRRNEFLFRSICRTCSRADRFESREPFHPLRTLHSDPASDEPGNAPVQD